jgi:hypothetical protein
MKNILVLTLILSLACKTSKPLNINPSDLKLYRLTIEFRLDTGTYEHTITITNQANDTISISRPDIQNQTASLVLTDTAGNLRPGRCYTSNERGIDWLTLPPGKRIDVTGKASLIQQFCKVNGDEQLAYRYMGYVKTTTGRQTVCVFTIGPVPINNLQTITLNVPVF